MSLQQIKIKLLEKQNHHLFILALVVTLVFYGETDNLESIIQQ